MIVTQNQNLMQNINSNQNNTHQNNQHSNNSANVHTNGNPNLNKNMIHGVVPIVHPVKNNMEYYGKNINIRSPPPETHGISINVNIQNMIQQRDQRDQQRDNEAPILSDRSGFGEDKKVKKMLSNLPNNAKMDDF